MVRIGQVQLFYRARLLSPEVAAGIETLELDLFEWPAIPWDDLGFSSVRWVLQRALNCGVTPGPHPPALRSLTGFAGAAVQPFEQGFADRGDALVGRHRRRHLAHPCRQRPRCAGPSMAAASGATWVRIRTARRPSRQTAQGLALDPQPELLASPPGGD